MSIWSTILNLDPCHEVDYSLEGSTEGGYLDIAISVHYGDQGLRFSLGEPVARSYPANVRIKPEAEVVLTRAQVAELVEVLQRWLDPTRPDQ